MSKKQEMTVNVVSYNEDGEVLFLSKKPEGCKFSKAGTTVTVSGNPASANIFIKAKNKGKWGDRIQVQIEPSGKGFSTMACPKEEIKSFTLAAVKIASLKLKTKIDPAAGNVVTFELKNAAELRKGDLLEIKAQNRKLQRKIVDIADKVVTVDTAFPKEMVFEKRIPQ
jgi:ribosomal 50S subunit-recycling heat shock protein